MEIKHNSIKNTNIYIHKLISNYFFTGYFKSFLILSIEMKITQIEAIRKLDIMRKQSKQ